MFILLYFHSCRHGINFLLSPSVKFTVSSVFHHVYLNVRFLLITKIFYFITSVLKYCDKVLKASVKSLLSRMDKICYTHYYLGKKLEGGEASTFLRDHAQNS